MSNKTLLKHYGTPIEAGNPQRTEAWALLQAAVRIKTAQTSGDADALRAAVRLNWRLWTILQADLLEPTSPVPTEIRANMLSLAAFVDKQTVRFLSEGETSLLDSLISINREISRGLSSAGESPAEAQGQVQATSSEA